jgi:hypothetical protein
MAFISGSLEVDAMAIKEGDRVQTKRELRGGLFGPDGVGKGKEGTVYKVTWSGKYHVRFDNGTKRDDLTDQDIEAKGAGWW